MTCARCGAPTADGDAFCVVCGEPTGPSCARCGAPLDPGTRFCTSCGASRDGVETRVEEVRGEGPPLPPPHRRHSRVALLAVGAAVLGVLALAGGAAALLLGRGDSTNSAPPQPSVVTVTAPAPTTPSAPKPAPSSPAAPAPKAVREEIRLTPLMIPPGSPYRCVSPWARDHPYRQALYLRYANGAALDLVSSSASDTSAEFLFCGGSAGRGRYGYASAPLRFTRIAGTKRIVRVAGILGADREASPGQQIQLDVLYDGAVICSYTTDGTGHARRFSCSGFPPASTLDRLVLHFDVAGDRDHGVYAGIARLRATLAVAAS